MLLRVRNLLISILILSISNITFAQEPDSAQELKDYAEACMDAIGVDYIPGFTCRPTENYDQLSFDVQDPSQFFIGQFVERNTFGRVFLENPDVDAVFLCRGMTEDYNYAQQVGFILQNKINGQTCFFDGATQYIKAEEDNLVPADLPWMFNNYNSTWYWNYVNENGWRGDSELHAEADPCWKCHANDPIVVSPAIMLEMNFVGLNYNGRKLFGGYKVVEDDKVGSFYYDWESKINQAIADNTNTCSSGCHALAFTDYNFFTIWSPAQENGSIPVVVETMLPIMSNLQPGETQSWYPWNPWDKFELNDEYVILGFENFLYALNADAGSVGTQYGSPSFADGWTFDRDPRIDASFEEWFKIKNVENGNSTYLQTHNSAYARTWRFELIYEYANYNVYRLRNGANQEQFLTLEWDGTLTFTNRPYEDQSTWWYVFKRN